MLDGRLPLDLAQFLPSLWLVCLFGFLRLIHALGCSAGFLKSKLKRFEPPLKIQGFTKTLIWHERTHKDPAYRWVRELIEKACLVEGK